MKKKIELLNNISLAFFFASSCSLLGIPAINLDGELPKGAYVIALTFWIGLLTGTVLQITAYFLWRKAGQKKTGKRSRRYLLPVICSFVFLLFIILFLKKSVLLISIDLAILFFSIEIYFYFKRRYSV